MKPTAPLIILAVLCLSVALGAAPCAAQMRVPAPNTLTPAEKAAGWRLLFDGKTTAGWRGFRKADMPAGWTIENGALIRTAAASDIVTVEQFGDFELAFEWKVVPGGNSGVFYRVTEESTAVWHSAPEYQILDNAGHEDGKKAETSAGSIYALYPPVKDVTRKPGEWNQARIVVKGTHVEHWLNGVKLVECEIGSPDWNARVAQSKFKTYPQFGTATRGFIAIQDHGDWVSYRNIRIRSL